MSDIAIRIENLGKRYRYGGAAPLSNNLRADLTEWVRGLWPRRRQTSDIRRPTSAVSRQPEGPRGGSTASQSPITNHESLKSIHERHLDSDPSYFWALRDINLEVRQGEVVGIIGRNGAGKSTLLKILSRITPPTTGRITYHGRVASLLEVGTGFHRELTGRENIYLNGSILGMKRAEIARKFAEIVAFAEVEKFIDTPVKFYSSGMYVRLAFAVAAHLEPEILVVDEVLAVGDANFQKKCLGKMGEVARQGRTIIFVSHNMAAIQNLCRRVVLLRGGQITADGEPRPSITTYLAALQPATDGGDVATAPRAHGLTPVIRHVDLLGGDDQPLTALPAGAPLTVRITYEHSEPLKDPHFGVIIEDGTGMKLIHMGTRAQVGRLPDLPPSGMVACHIPSVPLMPGTYYLTIGCGALREQLDRVERALELQIVESDFFGTGKTPPSSWSIFLVKAAWTLPCGTAATTPPASRASGAMRSAGEYL